MNDRTNRISGNTYDEERALYNLCDTEVTDCVFAGPADGESAFKEAHDITVRDCKFSLRYPFWHTKRFAVSDCTFDELTRAPLWYCEQGRLEDCTVKGVKCMRECSGILLTDCDIASPEFGWKCVDLDIKDCEIDSQYLMLECIGGHVDGLHLTGKYSFQYTRNLCVENSNLDTKDAFWHSNNVTVRNCTVRGEYLGWYSHGLTLENCHIIGTQPLCYCEDLTLINCTMDDTDLAFEYSSVNAEIEGHIVSVKNPKFGIIIADSIGEIIRENSVIDTNCEIVIRK